MSSQAGLALGTAKTTQTLHCISITQAGEAAYSFGSGSGNTWTPLASLFPTRANLHYASFCEQIRAFFSSFFSRLPPGCAGLCQRCLVFAYRCISQRRGTDVKMQRLAGDQNTGCPFWEKYRRSRPLQHDVNCRQFAAVATPRRGCGHATDDHSDPVGALSTAAASL